MAQKKKVLAPAKAKAPAPAKSAVKVAAPPKVAVAKAASAARPATNKPFGAVVKAKAPSQPIAKPAAIKIKGQSPVTSKPAVRKVDGAAVKTAAVVKSAVAKPMSVDARKAVLAAVLAKGAHVAAVPPRTVPAAAAKVAGQKLTASVGSSPAQTPKAIAEKTAAARQMLAAQKKPVSQRHGFKANEFVVYPAHGVGRIVGIEEQEIAGMSLELFVITFDKEKLTLRVPTGKLASVGMRKLADDGVVKKAMDTLKGRARIKRTMWSRRAQEYVAKINSGDLVSIAEVVRDLYRSEAQPEQSYSERQLYEDALDRMARELAAVEKLDERGAVQRITEVLSKSAKSRRAADGGESVSEAA